MKQTMRLAAALIAATVMVFGLVGCSSDSKDTQMDDGTAKVEQATEQAAVPEYPNCDDVWVVGQALPTAYEGCTNTAGDSVEIASAFDCNDGAKLTSYRDQFWVLGKGEITEKSAGTIADDPAYKAAYDQCLS